MREGGVRTRLSARLLYGSKGEVPECLTKCEILGEAEGGDKERRRCLAQRGGAVWRAAEKFYPVLFWENEKRDADFYLFLRLRVV